MKRFHRIALSGLVVMTAFANPILAGDTLVRKGMESENYQTGSAGWRIDRDGDAEFNDIVARGDVEATKLTAADGTGREIVIDPAQFGSNTNINLDSGDITNPAFVAAREAQAGLPPSLVLEGPDIDDDDGVTQHLGPTLRMFPRSSDNSEWPEFRFGATERPAKLFLPNDDLFIESPAMRPDQQATTTTNTIDSTGYAALPDQGLSYVFTAPPSGAMKFTVQGRASVGGGEELKLAARLGAGSTVGSGTAQNLNGSTSPSTDWAANFNTGGNSGIILNKNTVLYATGLTPGNEYNIEVQAAVGSGDSIPLFTCMLLSEPMM